MHKNSDSDYYKYLRKLYNNYQVELTQLQGELCNIAGDAMHSYGAWQLWKEMEKKEKMLIANMKFLKRLLNN